MHHKGTKYTKEHKDKADRLSKEILGAAIEVHRCLGPGLLESAYEAALAHELQLRGLRFSRQQALPLRYKGVQLGCACRIDLLVDDTVLLELKSVESLQPIHEAQLLTYLRHTGLWLGLLMNFNVPIMHKGIRRIVNG